MDKNEFNMQHGALLKEKHEDVVNNIKELQEIEKFMFQNLRKIQGTSDTAIQQREILSKINNLSSVRLELFSQLKNMYNTNQGELDSTRKQLSDQIATVGVVENELNRVKENINILETEKNNKLRMVEIGNYESARYGSHIDIMKTLVFCSVIILISSVLFKKNILPQHISSLIILSSLAYGVVYIVYAVYDLYRRDNMDFNKFNFNFDKAQIGKNYETVIEHDEIFFNKLYSGVRSEFNDKQDEISNTVKGLHKMGVSDNTPKGIENFSNY